VRAVVTEFKIPEKAQRDAAAALFPAMHPDEPITSFTGPFRFLSNFYEADVLFEGAVYPSVEHAFQAAKTFDEDERQTIRLQMKPGDAKRRGRNLKLRDDWEDVKIQIMEQLVLDKFVRHEPLRAKLLATGDRQLIEGNNHGDRFWGVSGGQGENWLGRILVRVRAHLG
jgi:ribA/ribD-fused uncharacterized protein